MALTLVGAGLGRTGTLSLKLALERLGLGPCYHMSEVLAHPDHVAVWIDALDGRSVDWKRLFAGYRSTVDWPACEFWRELAREEPAAKVLLSVRSSADAWYRSYRETISELVWREPPPALASSHAMAAKVLTRTFGVPAPDRAQAIDAYERHNAAVQREVPPERLLVFDVAQGWEPLCRFLGAPVPDEPFPRVNSTAEFRALAAL